MLLTDQVSHIEHARQAPVLATGVDFHYYEQGEGPLAPFMRGYVPTTAPADERYDMYTIAQKGFGPGSACEYVEGVGHAMLVESPARLTPRIVEFLRAGHSG